MSAWDKYLNDNGEYTEVQNLPPATHVTYMQGSQNKVLRIRVFVIFGFETFLVYRCIKHILDSEETSLS